MEVVLLTHLNTPYKIQILKENSSTNLCRAQTTQCWIIKASKGANQGVYLGQNESNLTFYPLAENDLLFIHKDCYFALTSGLEIIEIKNQMEQKDKKLKDIPDVKIISFNSLGQDYFYQDEHFCIQKISHDEVLCLSRYTSFTVKLNIRTVEATVLGDVA